MGLVDRSADLHTVPFAAQDIDSNPLSRKEVFPASQTRLLTHPNAPHFSSFFRSSPERCWPVRKHFSINFRSRRFWHKLTKLRLAPVLICVSMGRAGVCRSFTEAPSGDPLLLVPVADVEAQQHLNEAQLRMLMKLFRIERFAGPHPCEEDWPEVKSRLRASANFLKGRAPATASAGSSDRSEAHSMLKNSEASLVERDTQALRTQKSPTHWACTI